MQFSDVSRMFETMRATRAMLPEEQKAICIIEAAGQCGVDWVTYHQDTGDVKKVGNIGGQYFKGSRENAVHSDR